ncbi:HDOD domain-containing protein [Halorhodospira halochloris]|uniref:EAL and HDOD domain-containing protein n=1 Tax=Halorhodospira halochloris TaxID=1052 RepID=UPI001EE98303|nr:HDOD domain-containing protein [Halorhodospira halochloris]MCG5531006.1 HDOD domain-containing protein [Halorhodospira halochloris]
MEEVYLARQPIYNRDLDVCGYELLYRHGQSGTSNVANGDSATASVIENYIMSFGLESITGGKTAYINLTRNFFVQDFIPFQKHQVVLELLEDIEPDEELITSLQYLCERGYSIALDDYILDTDERHRLYPYVNIIKVDVLNMSYQEVARHARKLIRPDGPKLLAEKVENKQMMDLCRKAGFSYFQGFFLSRPSTFSTQSMTTQRVPLLRLIAALHDPEIDLRKLESIISQDLSLTYKLLRYISSPLFGIRGGVESIRSAILYLGRQELARWAMILALVSEDNQPAERVRSLLIRARVCEQLTKHRYGGSDRGTAFTVGLFSGLDAVFDCPMESICEQLPLSDETRQALINHSGPYGRVLEAALAQEHGDWDRLEQLDIPVDQLNGFYLEAVQWADEQYQQLASSIK